MSRRKFIIALITVTTLLALWMLRESLISALQWFSDIDAIIATIRSYDLWGPIALFFLILVQLFIAFIPGHALVAASGYVYGAPLTIAIVSTSGILGSQLVFLLARKYGKPVVYRLASQKTIEKWERIAGNRGALFYFFMFVLPLVPSDLMCYIAGLGKISPREFFIANFAGRLWATTETALIGAYGFLPPLGFWVLFLLSLAGLYAGWLIYDRAPQPTGSKKKFGCGK